MKIKLYHQIGLGGEDSAAVRKFISDNGLKDLIEFFNIKYDESRAAVQALTGGAAEAPVLDVDGKAIRGRELILDWLRTNVLAQRE